MKKIICLLFLLLLFPIKTNAIHEVIDSRCTNSLKTTLREEARGVVYRVSRTSGKDNVSYTAYFYNITDNIYITDSNGTVYNDSKIDNLKPGTRFIINMYASNKTYCEGYKISSRIINVPYYNPYFGSELCNGYESYSLCQENVNVHLSQDEFEKKLNAYKESLKEKEDTEIQQEVITDNEFSLYDFVMKYNYYLIGGLFFAAIILIIIAFNNRKKSGGIL